MIALPALITTLAQGYAVNVIDISCIGARFSGPNLPPVGAEGEITIGPIRMFGTVVWSRADECGLMFEDDLSLMHLEALRMKAGMPCVAKLRPEDRAALERIERTERFRN
jgi:hypothetical protein